MDYYYVNDRPQASGEHKVHIDSCQYFPKKRAYLGYFSNCEDAVEKAKEIYSNADGCFYCCRSCHTS